MPAFVFVCASIVIASCLAGACFSQDFRDIARAGVTWIVASFLYFYAPNASLFMAGMVAALYVLKPKDVASRVFYYASMLLAVPSFVALRLPFPGINYLYDLSYVALLNVMLVLPLAFAAGPSSTVKPPADKGHRRVVVVALLYLVLAALLDFRSTSFTNGMRQSFDYFLSYGILIFVLGRVSIRRQVVEKAVFGLFVAGIFICTIAFMQIATRWYLYSDISSNLLANNFEYIELFRPRGGQVRAPATMRPIPFGVYMALCGTIALYYSVVHKRPRIAVLLLPAFLLSMLLSGSRAAVLAFLIMAAILLFFSRRMVHFRGVLVFGTVLTLIAATLSGDLYSSFVGADPYGTFAYRVNLVINALPSISQNFFLGTPNFWSDPTLELSRQGQGIIDVVNAYLRVILQYGALGLVFFVYPLWLSVRRLIRARRFHETVGDADNEYLARLMVALLIGYALAIITVSLVDRLQHYFWILLILSSGVVCRSLVKNEVSGAER